MRQQYRMLYAQSYLNNIGPPYHISQTWYSHGCTYGHSSPRINCIENWRFDAYIVPKVTHVFVNSLPRLAFVVMRPQCDLVPGIAARGGWTPGLPDGILWKTKMHKEQYIWTQKPSSRGGQLCRQPLEASTSFYPVQQTQVHHMVPRKMQHVASFASICWRITGVYIYI